MATLTATGFEKLLARLDRDPARAADRYELLRQKLVRCFIWRGCPAKDADELADTALDRVAVKLAAGTEIRKLDAYAAEVSRFVWLEHTRKKKEEPYGDELPEQAVAPDLPEDPDERLVCLRKCLGEVAADPEERELIVGYYDRAPGVKIKEQRRSLAERFGINLNNLKVRAYRLRGRLEKCIGECLGGKM